MPKKKNIAKTFSIAADIVEFDDSGVRSYSPHSESGYIVRFASAGDPVEILFTEGTRLVCRFPKTKHIAVIEKTQVICNEA